MPGFVLGLRYLTGYAVATDPATREAAEWPPHPGRVFMALAAAHFETGEDPAERAALEWLESLDRPALRVSDASPRLPVTHFVPVNDTAGPSKALLQSAPALTRDRAGRTFPRVWPHDDTVYLIWRNTVLEPSLSCALERLCAKVVRVGHSSSFVQMWCGEASDRVASTLEPADRSADLQMRVITPGTLDYLRRQYNADAVGAFAALSELIATRAGSAQREAKREFRRVFGLEWKRSLAPPSSRRPTLSIWQGYRRSDQKADSEVGRTVFDPALIVLRLEPEASRYRTIDLVATLQVTAVLRRAVQQIADRDLGLNSIPEVLTGHNGNGEPSEKPHVAYLPLASVGAQYSDGHVMGVAVALPREEHWPAYATERRLVMMALARISELTLGRLGVWRVIRELREGAPHNLLPDTWTASPAGSRVWASVTPVVFDQHPKRNDRGAYEGAVQALIGRACVRAGLSEPTAVQVTPISKHLGVPAAHEFPRLARKDGSERRHAHVVIRFPVPVVGPLILGAGRYRGYGLCRPVLDNGGGRT